MKKLLFLTFFLTPGICFCSSPVRYVQISTNSLTQQTGSFNTAYGTTTIMNISTLTVTNAATITTTTFNGIVTLPNTGSTSQSPAISFIGNTGMGFARPASNTLTLNFTSLAFSTFTTTDAKFTQQVTTPKLITSSITCTSSATFSGAVSVPTGTVTGAAVNFDQLYTFAAPTQFTTAVDSVCATTDITFTKMGTKVSVTMGVSTHHVMLIVSGRLRNNTGGGVNSCSIFRDTTNLGDATNGMQAVSGTLGTPVTMQYLDAPGDTSTHSYEVYCKGNGTGTGHWGDAFTVVMMGWEVK